MGDKWHVFMPDTGYDLSGRVSPTAKMSTILAVVEHLHYTYYVHSLRTKYAFIYKRCQYLLQQDYKMSSDGKKEIILSILYFITNILELSEDS